MKIIIDKYSKFLFKILLIGLALFIIYLAYPKYQFYVSDGTVYRLNRITGEVTINPGKRPYTIPKPEVLKKR